MLLVIMKNESVFVLRQKTNGQKFSLVADASTVNNRGAPFCSDI